MSINSLLDNTTPKSWANIYINKVVTNGLTVQNDADFKGDMAIDGDFVITGNTVLEDVQIDGELVMSVGSQVNSDINVTGDINARSFEPTGQDSLKNVKKEELSITYSGDIFGSGASRVGNLRCVRCGSLITLTFDAESIGVIAGQSASVITANMGASFDEYIPETQVYMPIILKNPVGSYPADMISGFCRILTSGQIYIYYGIGTNGEFPVPTAGQTTGWQQSFSVSYIASN